MALSPGASLGPFEIRSAIGAGDMREVYKARDARLDRTVAIRVLPREVSADLERRARLDAPPDLCSLGVVLRETVVGSPVSDYSRRRLP